MLLFGAEECLSVVLRVLLRFDLFVWTNYLSFVGDDYPLFKYRPISGATCVVYGMKLVGVLAMLCIATMFEVQT